MAHEIDSIGFVGQTPWHGLGTYIGDQNVFSDEMQTRAKISWGVGREDVMVPDPLNPGQFLKIPGYKAIKRLDNNRVLSIMSDSYRPFQNKEKFRFFDQLVGEKLAMYHTAMSLDGGKKIAILAKLPGYIRVEGTDDITEKYLLLADSFDGSVAFSMLFTPIRVVCANTLNAALAAGLRTAFRLRHSGNLESKVEDARKSLGLAIKQYDRFDQEVNRLAKTRFTELQMKALAAELAPANEAGEVSARAQTARDTLVNLFENGRGHGPIRGTAWAALNAVAEYTDHHKGTRMTGDRGSQEAATLSVLFGSAQQMKQKAANLINQMAA
jgi:phage/plasmid-like protein (TIGR03299 family)